MGRMSAMESVERTIKIAAAGDIHACEPHRERIERAFAEVDDEADLILLAGDLTTHGDPEEASVLADASSRLATPVYAVLGNHDHHLGRAKEGEDALQAGGVVVLNRDSAVAEIEGAAVGIVGTNGSVCGFPGPSLPDLGAPLLRRFFVEAPGWSGGAAHRS